MRALYSILIYLLTPAMLLFFLFRGLKDRDWLKRWGERFGDFNATFSVRGIVVHAASVGEVNAAEPLIRAILKRWPDLPLTVTCFTPTGSQRIQSLFGEAVHHVYIPIDLHGSVWRFFKNLDPRLLIVMETEIWPNLYREARNRDIPILVSNARLTPRSAQGWSRYSSLAAATLQDVSLIAARTENDRNRFIELGANKDTTRVFGNLKFDIELPLDWRARSKKIREQWGASRTVLTAGSTHEADEQALFDSFQGILEQDRNALLVIVPRYPERFGTVAEAAASSGFEVQRLSDGPADANTQCLVVDQMGVLLDYYAAADITFNGGTLAEVGGHNPLEAAVLGKPIIMGPHTGHIEELTESLTEVNAAIQVNEASECSEAWMKLQTSPELRYEMGKAAQELVERERGALARNLEAVKALLATRG